jgi:hypothetical protein
MVRLSPRSGQEPSVTDEYFHRRPIILSHVCQRWRNISLNVSRLWTRIIVPLDDTRSRALHVFLQRSGSAPVDIIHNGFASSLVTYIASFTDRWRSCSFHSSVTNGRSWKYMIALFKNEHAQFGRLTKVNISLRPSSYDHATIRPSYPHCDRYPRLRSLVLQNVRLYYLPPDMFTHIRSLTICARQPQRMSNLLDCLSSTSQLRELIFSDLEVSKDVRLADTADLEPDTSYDIRSPVQLPHLHDFIWGYPRVADFRHFLSFLILPSIHLLDISLKNDDKPHTGQQGNSTTPFLRLDSVKDLTIECDSRDSLHGAFRDIDYPSITHLELRTAARSHEVLAPFNWSSFLRDPRVLHLTHLTLFRLRLTAQHLVGSFRYMPALMHLTFDLCEGANSAVCFLGGSRCGCIVLNGIEPSVADDYECLRLEALVFRDCDGLRMNCFETLARCRGEWRYGRGAGTEVVGQSGGRRIKPLRRRFQQMAIASGPDRADGNNLVTMPVKFKLISFESCGGVEEKRALGLRDIGVGAVEWRS